MAINPADITTVRVGELPTAPVSNDSKLAHEVGGILNQMTVAELITFISSQATARQYEKKEIIAPNETYITDNFDMLPSATQGIGKIGGLWEGWAICNGNNGTPNLDGQTTIGYGANYNTVGQFVGEEEHTLTINEMPSHSHSIKGSVNTSGGSGQNVVNNANNNTADVNTDSAGSGQPHNNMQPSMVILMIMKL